ncbi:MAG: chemotaxis protein CheB [Agriterribacter sp.]
MKPEYIVAIGGSAGFLPPLITLLKKTIANNTAYIVLRHIGSGFVSNLSEILKRHSILEIRSIEDLAEIAGDTVYVLPPDYYALVAEGKFILLKRRGYPNCALNIFLTSLAREYKSKAIAVILSGTGSNGSEGIIEIKRNGGFVLVQRPDDCEYRDMPMNAIHTQCVDEILLPDEMPAAIVKHQKQNEKQNVTGNLYSP